MINLTDKLVAVLVPQDFEIQKYGALDARNNVIWGRLSDKRSYTIPLDDKIVNIPYGEPKPKIIGTITKSGKFDFSCEKYVEKANSLGEEYYKDYNNSTKSGTYFTKEESFISLLNSKGIFLEELNNQKILILEKI